MNKDYKKIVETTLQILENKIWQNISLKEIKKKCKIKSFDKLVKNKKDILIKINHYFDYKLSKESHKIEKSNNKDMIFEIIMMRFDILQNHRKSIISLFNSFKNQPKELIFLFPELLNSILLMINYTKFSSKGIMGQLKVKGVFIVYLSSFLVWIKDDTPSLEKTMTALDNYLDKAGKILKLVNYL